MKQVRSIQFIQGTIINAMSTSVIGLLAYLVYKGNITVGELMSMYFYSFFVFGQLSQLGQVIQSYQEAKANDEIIQDILTREPEKDDRHLEKIEKLKTISLKDISFAYADDKEVVKNVSADWKAGQTVAFVGPS